VVAVATVDEFLQRVFRRPALLENAVHRRHQAGAVCAVLAVNEERTILGLLQHAHDFDDVFVIDAPGQDLHALGAQRGALHFVLVIVECAQVDDRADAELFQVLHAERRGLLATIERGRDAMQVRHALHLDGLRPLNGT